VPFIALPIVPFLFRQGKNAFPEYPLPCIDDVVVRIIAGVFEYHQILLWRFQAGVVTLGDPKQGQQVVCTFDNEHRERTVGAKCGQVNVRGHAIVVQADEVEEGVILAGLLVGLGLRCVVFGGADQPCRRCRCGDLGLVLADPPAHLVESAWVDPWWLADAFQYGQRRFVISSTFQLEQIA
jgi:hypothetical protein